MKVLLSWLNDYVDLSGLSATEIASKVNASGFEVDDVIDKSKGLERVIAAKILKITKHPNADKLVVCDVQRGENDFTQVVTGATNMKEGDIVPLAQDGSNLPCGKEIKRGMLRGVLSDGMFCGPDELGIAEDYYEGGTNAGLLILKPDVKIGTSMAEVLGLNDIVFDFSVLPNRPDCNSIIGLAREIAAMFNRPFKMPDLTYKTTKIKKSISVDVENYELCPRYMGTVITNVKNGQSPEWMKRRLTMLGHTPHSLFVDITNYVLCEMGQPMHAFDMSKIEGGKIIVRTASEGEKLVALNEKEYTLSPKNLVIANANKPMVIAGIMGGVESGTFEDTKDVFFESAVFNYANIRRSSNGLGLASDSSIRYAKGVYFDSAELGLKRALNLISTLGVGEISDVIIDKFDKKPEVVTIESDVNNINRILSVELPAEEMQKILSSLEIKTELKGNKLISTVPSFRTDMERECDIAEEIGRIYGLDKVDLSKVTSTRFLTIGKLTKEQENIDAIKAACVGEGFLETLNYRFLSPSVFEKMNLDASKAIKILNPIGQDYSTLRTNLAMSALNVIALNQRVKNNNYKIFELSTVFVPKALPLTELPSEDKHLLLASVNSGDYYTLKTSLDEIASMYGVEFDYRASTCAYMHPGKTADVCMYNRKIGEIGEIHPQVMENFELKGKVYMAEIDLTKLLERSLDNKKGKAPSKLFDIERDLALVVKSDVPASKILGTAKRVVKNEISKVEIFDIYEGAQVGEGLKSVAIKIWIKQPDKPLTEIEINSVVDRILSAEIKDNGAKLR